MSCRVVFAWIIMVAFPHLANASSNLIVNGDFEDPTVSQHFGWFTSIPGWQASEGQIEIQVSNGFFGGRQVVGQALTPGRQFVELDAAGNGAMYQDVPTVEGSVYELGFFYSPRNGWDGQAWPASTNVIDVFWEDVLVDSLSADGPNVPINEWTSHSYQLTANSVTGFSRLEFAAGGISDNRGGLIDKVTLIPSDSGGSGVVPEPTSGTIWLILLLAGVGLHWTHRRKSAD